MCPKSSEVVALHPHGVCQASQRPPCHFTTICGPPRPNRLDRKLNPQGANGPMIPPRSLFGLGGAWDLITTLRAIIRPYLPQGYPHLTLVAEIAGMSQRTLQRRLAQSGWTYSQLVEDARFSIASELLADPALNITDIALAAGYDNPSHFSRAFKRITGMTPRDYRRATG